MAESLYVFPSPPGPDAAEWAGSPIGETNTITRTKGRTAVHNKAVDETPGLLEKLLGSAREKMDSDPSKVSTHDVMIHGIRVHATMNSAHLFDFWVDNWYSLEEWTRLTGQKVPDEPQVFVYAFHGVEKEQEAAYYSRAKSTIVFFNTSYYGQLKSWVLGAVGRILAHEFGFHSIHGACVEKEGKGILYIAPTGTGKSTSSYGLMTFPKTRFHSDDWVYVRYTYATRDGRRVFLTHAKGTNGSSARGYRVYAWVEGHSRDQEAELSGMGLDNRPVQLHMKDLNLGQPVRAYAYTSEKVYYLRTNLAENFPLCSFQILASKGENIPDVTSKALDAFKPTIADMVKDILSFDGASDGAAAGGPDLRSLPRAELESICGRMIVFDNARSMLDIARVLPTERVFTNPMEPVALAAVMLLKRDRDDSKILDNLTLDQFMERLLIGETPDKKRETAYNAYRAVIDEVERAHIESLATQAGKGSETLYSLYRKSSNVPDSLEEEFELFRVMHQAVRCYDLNTVLQNDPTVKNKRQAVERTIQLIAHTLDREPHEVHLTLDDYAKFLA